VALLQKSFYSAASVKKPVVVEELKVQAEEPPIP